MICFFTYLITFQSLQHIYKHPPTHVFASAADDTCTSRRLYRQAYRHGNSILSQDSRTLYFFYPKLRHAPVSCRCGMNAVPYPICVPRGRFFTLEGFEHFIVWQIHRLVLNGYPLHDAGKGMHQTITQGKSFRFLHRTRESRKGSTQHQLQVGIGT